MRNFIFEETCKENDADRDDSDHDLGFHTEICSREMVDLRQSLKRKIDKNMVFCSFELVSMKRPSTFYQRLDVRLCLGMDKYSPLFYAFTCHNEAIRDSNYLPLKLSKDFSGNTLLHLTANGSKRTEVASILRRVFASGITNIFALQGDSLSDNGDFKYAVDLVTFIREQFGDTFCICVSGYPQMHPKSLSKELDLYHLKAKVEAGADFIITQIFFESQVFIDFVKDCQKIGIQVPIIPGILVAPDYECLQRMARICKCDIPAKIEDDLARIKHNPQAVRKFIVELTMQIITDVIKSGTTYGFHLFTLNKLSLVKEICTGLSFLNRSI